MSDIVIPESAVMADLRLKEDSLESQVARWTLSGGGILYAGGMILYASLKGVETPLDVFLVLFCAFMGSVYAFLVAGALVTPISNLLLDRGQVERALLAEARQRLSGGVAIREYDHLSGKEGSDMFFAFCESRDGERFTLVLALKRTVSGNIITETRIPEWKLASERILLTLLD